MLDIGSDSEVGKSTQDDMFTDTKCAVSTTSLKELEDVSMMSPKEVDDNKDIEDKYNDENSVQTLVKFTDNSNVDSSGQEELETDVRENDKIRQMRW